MREKKHLTVKEYEVFLFSICPHLKPDSEKMKPLWALEAGTIRALSRDTYGVTGWL